MSCQESESLSGTDRPSLTLQCVNTVMSFCAKLTRDCMFSSKTIFCLIFLLQTSTLLDNAEKWGVKIVTLPAALKWIEKELQKLPKTQSKVKVVFLYSNSINVVQFNYIVVNKHQTFFNQ